MPVIYAPDTDSDSMSDECQKSKVAIDYKGDPDVIPPSDAESKVSGKPVVYNCITDPSVKVISESANVESKGSPASIRKLNDCDSFNIRIQLSKEKKTWMCSYCGKPHKNDCPDIC